MRQLAGTKTRYDEGVGFLFVQVLLFAVFASPFAYAREDTRQPSFRVRKSFPFKETFSVASCSEANDLAVSTQSFHVEKSLLPAHSGRSEHERRGTCFEFPRTAAQLTVQHGWAYLVHG